MSANSITNNTYIDNDDINNDSHNSNNGQHDTTASQPGSISARSSIMYTPLELRGCKPSQRKLIESYRNQLLAYERERQSHIDRIDDVEGHTGNERMQLRNTVKQLNDRVYDLQRGLSDAHIHLYNERKLVIHTQQQNSELNIHNIESNKRIQHLLAMTAPVQNETTYFVASKPLMNMQPHPTNRHAIQQSHNNNSTSTTQHASAHSNSTPHQHYGPHSNTADNRQSRTVTSSDYPQHQSHDTTQQQQLADHTTALNDTIKSLRKQLKQQDKLHKQELQAYIEDRTLRENDIKYRESQHQQQLSATINGVKSVEDKYRNIVRELLQYKANTNQQIRLLNEQIAALQSDNSKLRHDIALTRSNKKLTDDHTIIQQRNKISQAEEDLGIIKQQYQMSQQLYDKRINYLTDRLHTVTQKYNVLYERRNLEFEGFNTDYKQIRERLRQLENILVAVRSNIQPQSNLNSDTIQLSDELSNQFISIDTQFQQLLQHLQTVSQRLQLATT